MKARRNRNEPSLPLGWPEQGLGGRRARKRVLMPRRGDADEEGVLALPPRSLPKSSWNKCEAGETEGH